MRSEKHYARVEALPHACSRTKERVSRYKAQEHRWVVLEQRINEVLVYDGFVPGEPMVYFGIDLNRGSGLWSRAWEGWLPESEIVYEMVNSA